MGDFFFFAYGVYVFFRLRSQFLTTVPPTMFLKNVRYALLDVRHSRNKHLIAC